jgi:hypothetical protein
MSLFQKIFYGQDLDEIQAKDNEVDAALKALNDRKLAEGSWTADQYNQAEANRERSYNPDIAGDVNKTFGDALDDNLTDFRGAVGSTISFPFKLIPWQVWALAAVALFFYMGGAAMLKGRLIRK